MSPGLAASTENPLFYFSFDWFCLVACSARASCLIFVQGWLGSKAIQKVNFIWIKICSQVSPRQSTNWLLSNPSYQKCGREELLYQNRCWLFVMISLLSYYSHFSPYMHPTSELKHLVGSESQFAKKIKKYVNGLNFKNNNNTAMQLYFSQLYWDKNSVLGVNRVRLVKKWMRNVKMNLKALPSLVLIESLFVFNTVEKYVSGGNPSKCKCCTLPVLPRSMRNWIICLINVGHLIGAKGWLKVRSWLFYTSSFIFPLLCFQLMNLGWVEKCQSNRLQQQAPEENSPCPQ